MQKFEQPYLHYVIPNFLSEQEYSHTLTAYSKLNFIEKTSDLFHFFQTNQLAQDDSILPFRTAIRRQFGKLTSLKDSSFNIFASFYFQGDYLLCHDDVIEDRRFAFSYYLEDHPSAELVLYDDKAMKEVKRIKVTKNLLAVFEVSNISYHEVAQSKQNGRKAITGWLNIKGHGATRPVKQIAEFKPTRPKNAVEVEFPIEVGTEEHAVLPDVDYDFTSLKEVAEGPLFQRKVTRLTLQQPIVPKLSGKRLLSADYYHFRKGDYILLNDPVNSLRSVLDVFVVQLVGKRPKSTEDALIDIVGKEGTEGAVTASHNHVFVVQRGEKQYYFRKAEREYRLGHLIYEVAGQETKKSKSAKQRAAVNNKNKGIKKTSRQVKAKATKVQRKPLRTQPRNAMRAAKPKAKRRQ